MHYLDETSNYSFGGSHKLILSSSLHVRKCKALVFLNFYNAISFTLWVIRLLRPWLGLVARPLGFKRPRPTSFIIQSVAWHNWCACMQALSPGRSVRVKSTLHFWLEQGLFCSVAQDCDACVYYNIQGW